MTLILNNHQPFVVSLSKLDFPLSHENGEHDVYIGKFDFDVTTQNLYFLETPKEPIRAKIKHNYTMVKTI